MGDKLAYRVGLAAVLFVAACAIGGCSGHPFGLISVGTTTTTSNTTGSTTTTVPLSPATVGSDSIADEGDDLAIVPGDGSSGIEGGTGPGDLPGGDNGVSDGGVTGDNLTGVPLVIVPEPATGLLLLCGAAVVALRKRARR